MCKVIHCNEERIYWCKHGQIPFKARVRLYAKVYFPNGYKMGFFESYTGLSKSQPSTPQKFFRLQARPNPS